MRFQFPVPGGERQFVSPRWTHAIVILSFGVVCAIFQFLKINVIFGMLCCATASWMEGGAESGCKVVWAEAVSCCREQFLEATKGKSPLFLQDPFAWCWWSSCKPPTYLGRERGKVVEVVSLCICCVPYLPSLSNLVANLTKFNRNSRFDDVLEIRELHFHWSRQREWRRWQSLPRKRL